MAEEPVETHELPFKESLCHRCAAPPRYVRTATSVFILCPLLAEKYPRQPVLRCPKFIAKPDEDRADGARSPDS